MSMLGVRNPRPANGLGFTCGRPSLGGAYQVATTAAMAKPMAAREA